MAFPSLRTQRLSQRAGMAGPTHTSLMMRTCWQMMHQEMASAAETWAAGTSSWGLYSMDRVKFTRARK